MFRFAWRTTLRNAHGTRVVSPEQIAMEARLDLAVPFREVADGFAQSHEHPTVTDVHHAETVQGVLVAPCPTIEVGAAAIAET